MRGIDSVCGSTADPIRDVGAGSRRFTDSVKYNKYGNGCSTDSPRYVIQP